MSIPAILLAIALVSLSRGSGLRTVILAIVIPEVPRVVRLVRSVVLSVRGATGSPHSRQNLAEPGNSARHFAQASASFAPHSKQNFAWGGFSCWHRRHFILGLPASRAGFQRRRVHQR